MRPSDREYVLSRLRPLIPEGGRLYVTGQAICYEPPGAQLGSLVGSWYIDCPSWAGSIERRQVGTFVPDGIFGSKGCWWTEQHPRVRGKYWHDEVIEHFIRFAGLTERREELAREVERVLTLPIEDEPIISTERCQGLTFCASCGQPL